MEEGEKKPKAGTLSGSPQKKIVYAVLAIAVVILAVVLVAKFAYNTDLLNMVSGEMSMVRGQGTGTPGISTSRDSIQNSDALVRNQSNVDTGGSLYTGGKIVPVVNKEVGGLCEEDCGIFGFGFDVLNPASGQMSLVQRPPVTIVRPNITLSGPGVTTTPAFQRVTTPIPRLTSCTADQTDCNGACVNLNTDSGNCGSCGHACPSGKPCTFGTCCASPVGDPKNCGGVSCFVASGNIYAPCGEENCQALCLEINPWDADCGLTTGAHHVKLYSDVNNCGGCGFRCNASEICDHMKCQKP